MKQIVVIKIGSSVLTGEFGNIDVRCVRALVQEWKQLVDQGFQLVVAVSGAVKLGNSVFVYKQAAAAVGQVNLMVIFQRMAKAEHLLMGQLLLRRGDMRQGKTRKVIAETIEAFWNQNGVVLVNENDVVELNSFGGNDYLALELARLVGAKTLVLLSDVDGLWDQDKQVVPTVGVINRRVWQWVDDNTSVGVGGMTAKLKVAQQCLREGKKLVIANGKKRQVLTDLLIRQLPVGTKFVGGGYEI